MTLLSTFAVAEDTKPAPTRPVISAEHRARYWRRDAENQRAQQAAAAAQAALAAAVADLQKDCGADFTAILDDKGEASCEAVPQASPVPAK